MHPLQLSDSAYVYTCRQQLKKGRQDDVKVFESNLSCEICQVGTVDFLHEKYSLRKPLHAFGSERRILNVFGSECGKNVA